MEVLYAPTFLRMLKALPAELQEEATKKIELFRRRETHKALKVHKLKGRLVGRYSFSINYHIRVVFLFSNIRGKRSAYLLAIGDHAIYR